MNTILRLAFLAALILCAELITAQCSHHHHSAGRNFEKELATIAAIDARYRSDVEGLEKEFKKDFEKAYENRKKYLEAQLSNGQFLFDTPINDMLDRVFSNIVKANPDITKSDIRVMLNRSGAVNAASYGDGTIDFNLGLFTQLQNEDQLAFVMCHELAHYKRNHGNKAIARKIKKINSKNFKNKVKDIRKNDFNKYSKAEELMDDLAFTVARHSKLKEVEADRIGFEYFNNTEYDSLQAMTLLRVLDASNDDGEQPVDIKGFFDFDGYAFNPAWLNEDQSFHENGKQALRGRAARMANVKTHPDCEERIMELTDKQYDSLAYVNNVVSPEMQKLRVIANKEIIEFLYQRGNIGLALFNVIKMIENEHEDQYLYAMVSKCFFDLNNAQKKRVVGKILETAKPSYHPDHNRLLTMLNNLTNDDIVHLHNAFYNERQCASAETANQITKEINAYLQGKTSKLSDSALAMIGDGAVKRLEEINTIQNDVDASSSKKSLSRKEKKNVNNMMSFSFSSLNPMIKDGKVRGYFLYYQKELKDKSTVAYEVVVYDQNLNQFAKKTISGSRDMYMMEGSYNGDAFCFKLYDGAEKKMMYKMFDNNFASLGTKKVEIFNLSKMPVLSQMRNEKDEVSEKTIFPIEGLGFAAIVPAKEEDQGLNIRMYPQVKGEKGWTFKLPSTDQHLAYIKFIGQNTETLFFEILKSESEDQSKNGFAILGIQKASGELKFETFLDDQNFAYYVNTTSYDKVNDQVMILGNYINKGNLFRSEVGDGIANLRINSEGEIAGRSHLNWKDDFSQFLKIRDDGRVEDKGFIFSHKIVNGYDDTHYIIGELYHREPGNTLTKDIVIAELDKEYNLVNASLQEKSTSKFKNPKKSNGVPSYVVAKVVRLNRGFDYSYTLMNDNAKDMTICYKEKSSDAKDATTIFKMLTVKEDGTQSEDQIALNNQNRTIRIMPGKEGFFVVAEYDFGDKSLSLRQERVSY